MKWIVVFFGLSPYLINNSTGAWWMAGGPMVDSSTSPYDSQSLPLTPDGYLGPIKGVLFTTDTPDCYVLSINPNGSVKTTWHTCPK